MHLVTGANGLIGSYICRAMLQAGYTLRAIRRSNSDMSLVLDIQDQIEWVEGDLLDVAKLTKQMEEIEGIVHSAAYISYDSREESMMQKINAEGTANMVNAALSQEVKHFLHISSVAAVGKRPSAKSIDESNTITLADELTGYARSKWLSEVEVWRGIAEGLPAVILNPSLVLGPGNLSRSSTQVFKYIQQERRFYTSGIVNYVDVRDVAEVAKRVVDQRVIGERYIVNAGSIAYKQFFEKIAKVMEKKPPGIEINASLIKWISMLDRIRTSITKQKPLISDELAQVAKNNHTYTSRKIEEAVGIQFRPLNETVEWCIEELAKKEEKIY